MRIKESTIRRILREEYRRVLTEGEGDPNVSIEPKMIEDAVTKNPAMSNSPEVKAIRAFQSDYRNGLDLLTKAVEVASALGNGKLISAAVAAKNNYVNDVQKKGIASAYGKAVVDTMQKVEGIDKNATFRAVIASLSTGKSYRNETAAGGKNATAYDNDLSIGTGFNATDFTVDANYLNALTFLKRVCSFDLAGNYNKISSGAAAPSSAPAEQTHTVAPGDSISKILQDKYGIPASSASMPLYTQFASMQTPPIADVNKVEKGAQLKLPAALGKYALK